VKCNAMALTALLYCMLRTVTVLKSWIFMCLSEANFVRQLKFGRQVDIDRFLAHVWMYWCELIYHRYSLLVWLVALHLRSWQTMRHMVMKFDMDMHSILSHLHFSFSVIGQGSRSPGPETEKCQKIPKNAKMWAKCSEHFLFCIVPSQC